ncbi:MAG: DMT family transporter [Clostridiaceae bacterium]|nr:DMT family transporter [Clostridiaceae bacterium]
MSKQLKAELALLSITVVWGSSFIVMKNISEDIPPYAYLTLRFLVAGLLMGLIFHKNLKTINKKAILSGITVGLFLFGGMILQVIGLRTTSASNSAFITGLNVIMVPVISATLLKKRPPLNAVVGVILATLGLFALTGFSGRWVIGDTLTLLCAVCFAFQIIFIDKYASDVDVYQLATVQVATAGILCALTWAFFGIYEQLEPIEFNRQIILTILYTGAIGTAFAYGIQTIAQKYTTPTRTALLLTFEPVFGAIFALIVPDARGVTEKMSLETFLGCLLILSGMMVTEMRFVRKKN